MKKGLLLIIVVAVIALIAVWQVRLHGTSWLNGSMSTATLPSTSTTTTATTTPATTTPQVPADIQAHIDAYADKVVLESHDPYDYISSPVTFTGKAAGWYFEGSFPVILVDWNGLIIAEGAAQAQGDWMTSEFVPFTVTLTFTKPPFDERGAIIFKKDNPSGLPENDDAMEIPIRFQ